MFISTQADIENTFLTPLLRAYWHTFKSYMDNADKCVTLQLTFFSYCPQTLHVMHFWHVN